jgi:hypothetical protein
VIILNITTHKDQWMSAFMGSVKRCQTQSLFFPDCICLWSDKGVGTKVALNYTDQVVHLEGAKTGVLSSKTKWSMKWKGWGWGRFEDNVICLLQGCQMREYPTGYL